MSAKTYSSATLGIPVAVPSRVVSVTYTSSPAVSPWSTAHTATDPTSSGTLCTPLSNSTITAIAGRIGQYNGHKSSQSRALTNTLSLCVSILFIPLKILALSGQRLILVSRSADLSRLTGNEPLGTLTQLLTSHSGKCMAGFVSACDVYVCTSLRIVQFQT